MSLNIDILDVGQGDGIVVWFPNGKTMMVDLGSTKNKGIVTDDSFAYFSQHTKFARTGETLDYLVLTHGDRDHYNMIVPFVQKFRPKILNIVHGGPPGEYTAPGGNLIDWLRSYMASTYSLPVTTIGSAPKFPFGLGPGENSVREFGAEVLVLCMGLRADGDAGYVKNSKSVVLQIRYPANTQPQRVVTLTGDATRHVEKFILDTYRTTGALTTSLLRSDILKVGHHGSHRTSNHAEWIKAVNPYFAFLTSDRSGSLDGDQIATGHRLPQHLVLDLLKKYAPRLAKKIGPHPYVSSYQRKDYEEYNLAPDIPGEKLDLPTFTSDGWIQNYDNYGIFSTLASLGPRPEDPDQGAQYRIELTADAAINISGTADFTAFNPITGLFRE